MACEPRRALTVPAPAAQRVAAAPAAVHAATPARASPASPSAGGTGQQGYAARDAGAAPAAAATPIRATVRLGLGGIDLAAPLAQAEASVRAQLRRNVVGGGLVVLDGGSERLTRLPAALAEGEGRTLLTRLRMRGHRMVDVSRGLSLAGFDRLAEATLRGNGLREVPPGLLALPALRECDLGGNEIEALPPIVARLLPALRELRLDDNRLRALPPSLFALPALALLDVRANPLASLPVEALRLETAPRPPVRAGVKPRPPACRFLVDPPPHVPPATHAAPDTPDAEPGG